MGFRSMPNVYRALTAGLLVFLMYGTQARAEPNLVTGPQRAEPKPAPELVPQGMDQQRLEALVKAQVSEVAGQTGGLEFNYQNVKMALISDASHNRMRIIAPIAFYPKLTREQLDSIMVANFHSALDARYAVSDGVLYSVFIHPISTLTEIEIKAALYQVANLALSFGTGYSSGILNYAEQFGGEQFDGQSKPSAPALDESI